MAKYKLMRGTAKGKARKAVPIVKGAGPTIQGGQKGAKVKPGTPKAKAFKARHGTRTPKQKINMRIRNGSLKIGDTFTLKL